MNSSKWKILSGLAQKHGWCHPNTGDGSLSITDWVTVSQICKDNPL